jgi:hypothetical protein
MRKNLRNKWIGLGLGVAAFLAAPVIGNRANAQEADPYLGHFTAANGMSMDVSGTPTHYVGVIHVKDQNLPLRARQVDRHVEGSFTSNGQSYAFTAQRDGTMLSLTSGTSTYQLAAPAPAPAVSTAAVSAPSAGRLTVDQVGEALTPLGKNSINDNGNQYFTINVKQGQTRLNVVVSLSPNGNIIWITCSVSKIPDPRRAAPEALAYLLAKNSEIGPIFFDIVPQQGMIQMSEPVANSGMTPELLRQYLGEFVETAQKTEPLWRQNVITPGAANGG